MGFCRPPFPLRFSRNSVCPEFRLQEDMKDALPILLRVAGAGLILLAGLHLSIGRHLNWCEDAARLSPVNAAIFHVHTFFICFVLVMMGLPCFSRVRRKERP